MTEVEKIELKYKNAEESFEKWIDENCYKDRSNEYFESLYGVRKEAFANGYEQGQKDYKEFCECFCLKDGKFIQVQLEKENEKLKECIKMQENEVQELYESYERRLKPLQKENEELKATISKTETTTEKNSEVEELKAQIEQLKKQYKKQRNRRLDERLSIRGKK